MNAIAIYVGGYMGFACLPPPTVKLERSPYNGPFVMSLIEAEQIQVAASKNSVWVIREDSSEFSRIHCPGIFF